MNRQQAIKALYRQAREEAQFMRLVPWHDADTGDIIYVKIWASEDILLDERRIRAIQEKCHETFSNS